MLLEIIIIIPKIEKIFKLDPKRQIYITADHGMNQKLNIVNMQKISEKAGFDVFCLPPLKDRYIENHIYQEGGMLYVFLNNKSQVDGFLDFIKKQPYVEQILTREEAASVYHLPIDKIGDYVLFSSKLSAFGEPEKLVIQTNKSRTHGSVYEREIPLIAVNPKFNPESYSYNKDIVSNILSAE